jgi:hypothetical protein
MKWFPVGRNAIFCRNIELVFYCSLRKPGNSCNSFSGMTFLF